MPTEQPPPTPSTPSTTPSTLSKYLVRGLADPEDFTRPFDVSKRIGDVPHAPKRHCRAEWERQALANALRYIPPTYHHLLAQEFLAELRLYGHIYMYRFRPVEYEMRAYPLSWYPAKCRQAAALQLMIMNNLDRRVAQYPHELVTYGGNGSVLSNWAQYQLVMKYLSEMSEQQTLVMYSGHPMGLFPASADSPRMIVTNGIVVPNYSRREDYDQFYALGVSQYGQMTAGSYCYIGPAGIVHGTTITLVNAARKYLSLRTRDEVRGVAYVSAGLGGMSGAQAKAAVIAGMICVVAELDESALNKRFEQGWVMRREHDLEEVIRLVKEAKRQREPLSIGWLGNVVDLWERLAKEPEPLVELGSDQTSLHNPYMGGYYPAGLTFTQSRAMMTENPEEFKRHVQASLRRHVVAINRCTERGMRWWDYGNAFLLEASRAQADIMDPKNKNAFRYPSYFEHIMGDVFSLGFGPFRWVCTSGEHADLMESDRLAAEVLRELLAQPPEVLDARVRQQYEDNLDWIVNAEQNRLVVGSEARILYANADGRVRIALRFNQAIRDGRIKAPIMLSRDHHDVSGTDSPFRETANITDGSKFTADMAVHNFVGDAMRGATSVSLHNGGGTGWGEAMNGGFLLFLDGSNEAASRARRMLFWDVNNGVARRSWSGNANAQYQINEAMKHEPSLRVTMPNQVNPSVLDSVLNAKSQ